MELINSSSKNTVAISSVNISALTGKNHSHIMRDIRLMLAELELGESIFGSTYYDAQGKERPMFLLPKREALILSSGYNIQLRAKIIDKLEQMENNIPKLPTDPMEILSLVFDAQKATNIELIEIKTEIEELKGDIVLTPSQKRILQKSVATKVYSFNAPKESNKKLFSAVYSKLKDRFAVSSYMEIPRLSFNEAKSMVDNITLIDLV